MIRRWWGTYENNLKVVVLQFYGKMYDNWANSYPHNSKTTEKTFNFEIISKRFILIFKNQIKEVQTVYFEHTTKFITSWMLSTNLILLYKIHWCSKFWQWSWISCVHCSVSTLWTWFLPVGITLDHDMENL